MIVVGGSYLEVCHVPHWHRVFGSGGRAAIAVSTRASDVEFHTYAGKGLADDVTRTMHSFGIKVRVKKISEDLSFSYFHPLSSAILAPTFPRKNRPLKVRGGAVLRFGFVEGDAVIEADYAVYDPQGGQAIERFEENGSKAKHLAYVLNENEILDLTKKASVKQAATSLLGGATEVVVVKRGPDGATIYQKGGRVSAVPAYEAQRVFKIGSGDVYSAIFAHEWAENKSSPSDAADAASRAVASYVESRSLPIPAGGALKSRKPLRLKKQQTKIYLAGPFFDIAKRWLIEESLNALESLGASVFSPFHDVGFGDSKTVAKADLSGMDECQAVLALIDGSDPGTLFEIGYARRKNLPVVALGENVSASDLTMLLGTDCEVVDDFATAIYRVVWKSRAK